MTPVTVALALALAAPAPKAVRGLPNDLIDLLPEDTTAVVVLDTPKGLKSDLGQVVLKLIAAEQSADGALPVADVLKDAELVLMSQFLIDDGFGDFCFVIRLQAASGLPKTLLGRAEKAGKDKAPEEIGKRTVYTIDHPALSFAQVDDRTLMLVVALGDEKQVKQTRAAAYGVRERPGPSAALRKMLAEDGKDDRAVRVYGHHPTKLAHSAGLVLAPFGTNGKEVVKLGNQVVSYRGGIREGAAAEVELRVTARDEAAADKLLKLYEAGAGEKDAFVREFRGTARAVRDGTEVVLTGKLTRAMIERLATGPNR